MTTKTKNEMLQECFASWLANTPLTIEQNGYTLESLQWAFNAGVEHAERMLQERLANVKMPIRMRLS